MPRVSIVLLSSVLVLSTLFGGCVGGEEKDADPTTSDAPGPSDSAGTSSSPGTSPVADENNTAPNLTFTPSVANGSAPINITFTLDASDGEGDALTWTIDADGDGETDGNGTSDDLPAEFNFTFAAPGVFNATFVASDGELEANKTIAIEIVEGVPAFTDLSFSGTISGLWVGDVTGVTGQGAYLPPDGEDVHTFDLTAAPTKMTVSLSWDGMQGYDLDLILFSPDGEEVARATSVNIPGDDAEEPIIVEDATILAKSGTWTMEVLSAGSLECDYEILVDFE